MDYKSVMEELKEVRKDLVEIKTTLAVNTANLGEHMRRTEVIEKRLDSVWSKALTAVSLISGMVILFKTILP